MRVALVSSLRQVDLALPGNKGSIYDILVKIRPDVVALGYDQRHKRRGDRPRGGEEGRHDIDGEARVAHPRRQDLEDPDVALSAFRLTETLTSRRSPFFRPRAPRRKWGEIISRTLSS